MSSNDSSAVDVVITINYIERAANLWSAISE